MASFIENVAVLNSTVRTAVALLFLGAISAAGIFGYRTYNAREIEAREAAAALDEARGQLSMAKLELREKSAEIVSLNKTVSDQRVEIDRLDTAMRLLKVEKRVAQLVVLNQEVDPESNELISTVEFQELNEHDEPMGDARQFRVVGDLVYVDSWIVKFDDQYVEQADLHRSTSLVLFRRLFGEHQLPSEGFSLDAEGARPGAYGRGKISEYEQQIWDDFWNVANDKQRQVELGIRAAHGEAPSIKLKEGKTYRITLRASGGLTVDAAEETRPKKPAA